MFVNKQSETMEYVKNQSTFQEIFKLDSKITRKFLELGMPQFAGYCSYMNTNVKGDFQIRISAPLLNNKTFDLECFVAAPQDF